MNMTKQPTVQLSHEEAVLVIRALKVVGGNVMGVNPKRCADLAIKLEKRL